MFKYTLKFSSTFQTALALRVFKNAAVYHNHLYLHSWLLESRKIDQYTYYRRNEEIIREFGEWYAKEVSLQCDNADKLLQTVNIPIEMHDEQEET